MKYLTIASFLASLLVIALLPANAVANDTTGVTEHAPHSDERAATRPQSGREASEASQRGKPPEHAGQGGRPDHAGQGGSRGQGGRR